MTGRRSSSQPRSDRRAAFVDAAITVVRRDGPGASMEAMAREAGVTKPILYRVFGDRDGLVHAMGERFALELVAVLAEALHPATAEGPAPVADPRAVVRATIDAYVGLIDRDPALYRFLTTRLGAATQPHVADLASEVARNVAVVLADQLRAVGADSGPAEPWAYAIVGMVHMAGDWWVERRTISREALVDHLVTLVWDGLGSLAAAGGPAGALGRSGAGRP